jgi:hypothetical protein
LVDSLFIRYKRAKCIRVQDRITLCLGFFAGSLSNEVYLQV